MDSTWKFILFVAMVVQVRSLSRLDSYSQMKCSYGERGSLTATCVNATPEFFKTTPYRFDHLDETLKCETCNLETLGISTFDLSGNQILHLDLRNSKIKNIKPRAFVGLVFLEDLNLSHNEIIEIVPGTFNGVKKIIAVDLHDNAIVTLHNFGFQELINLQKLSLSKNKISTIEEQSFKDLKNIKELDLSDNQIKNVSKVFNNLITLEVINLSHNDIETLTGSEFDNLTSLLQISFAHNRISSIPVGEFQAMFNLRSLDLSFNLINNLAVGSFAGLLALENMDLSHNIISQLPRQGIHNLHALRNLNLSYNSLTIFQTGLFSSGLPELRVLNLSHNAINAVEVTGIFSLHSLHTLDLSSNHITDFDYKRLVNRLPRISFLGLAGNAWACYLEKEMNEYFSEDNFKFALYETNKKAVNCTDSPHKHESDDAKERAEELVGDITNSRVVYSSMGKSATVWIFTLIAIIMVLVGLLGYSQFRIYRFIRQPGLRSATSTVQLISSDLEQRDNDYLKE